MHTFTQYPTSLSLRPMGGGASKVENGGNFGHQTEVSGAGQQWHIPLHIYLFCLSLSVCICVPPKRGHLFPWLSWNSLFKPNWPWTHTSLSVCLCLLGAGIRGVYCYVEHHHSLLTYISMELIFSSYYASSRHWMKLIRLSSRLLYPELFPQTVCSVLRDCHHSKGGKENHH